MRGSENDEGSELSGLASSQLTSDVVTYHLFLPINFLSGHSRVCIFDFSLSASQRVPGEPEVPLVPRAGDIRPGDVRAAAGAQGDVGGQDGEEQDNQL